MTILCDFMQIYTMIGTIILSWSTSTARIYINTHKIKAMYLMNLKRTSFGYKQFWASISCIKIIIFTGTSSLKIYSSTKIALSKYATLELLANLKAKIIKIGDKSSWVHGHLWHLKFSISNNMDKKQMSGP